MIKLLVFAISFITVSAVTAQTAVIAPITPVAESNPVMTKSIYGFKVEALDGKTIDFSKFKGKKILVVNTASQCGYTPQYEGLEKLYEQYKDKLVIVGFPANNFGAQEPGTNGEISDNDSSFIQKEFTEIPFYFCI